jgi:hypothetical protein
MTALGSVQLGGKAESTYGTPVVVDRFWPFISSNLAPDYAITSAADELRAGSIVERVEQDDPYIAGGGGSIDMYVPTKGFGLLISHALGSASIGSITDSNYTQNFVLSATGKNGKSLTLQDAHPFNPAGTAQPFTWHGCKILSIEFTLEEGGYLKTTIEVDCEDVDTSTSLATASYPTLAPGASKFPWRLSSLTIAASQVEVKSFRCKITWPMNVDRRFIRGSALKKEPVPSGKPTIEWDMQVEFTDLTQYNRVASATMAARVAQIILTCDAAVALAGITVPRFTLTLPAARFDEGLPSLNGDEPLMQDLSGVGLDDGTNQPVTITYRTTDSAA